MAQELNLLRRQYKLNAKMHLLWELRYGWLLEALNENMLELRKIINENKNIYNTKNKNLYLTKYHKMNDERKNSNRKWTRFPQTANENYGRCHELPLESDGSDIERRGYFSSRF